MRSLAAVFVCLMIVFLQAAPIPKNAMPTSLGPAPVVEWVAQGCSAGWHRGHWQDSSGEWHWGDCFPSWR